jgi:RNA polymerase sigma-70 factor (ECF subfamily)
MSAKELPSDDNLLRCLQQGDEQAFEQIYLRYASDLVGFAAGRVQSLAEAKDIIQEVFLSLWTRRSEINITRSIRSYLYAAARYKIIDHIRKNMQRGYYVNLLASLSRDGENTIYDDLIYKEMDGIIDGAIDQLPSRTREVFLMSRKRHLSVREIAQQLDLSEQTVKNQLSAALKRLRPLMQNLAPLIVLLFH